jgi:hypothetical protein
VPSGAGATPRSGPAGCWVRRRPAGQIACVSRKAAACGVCSANARAHPSAFSGFPPPPSAPPLWPVDPALHVSQRKFKIFRRKQDTPRLFPASRPSRALPPPRPLQFKLRSPHRPCQARGPRGGAGHRRQRHRSPPRGPCGPPTSAGRPCSLRQQLRQ